MSPSPSIANCAFSPASAAARREERGNSSLMGASKFFATDTMTGVQKTQKMS
jgi:hypothetical protein